MRVAAMLILSMVAPVLHAQGILKRYGADGSMAQRYGGVEQEQEVIMNGQRYRVQRGGGDADGRVGVDPQTGRAYPDVGSGAINPATGQYYPRVRGGYVDPATGVLFPAGDAAAACTADRTLHMAHEIDFSNGRANMAYVGGKPWHGLGFELTAGASLDNWRKAAGLDWRVQETPALYRCGRRATDIQPVPDHKVLMRSDTRAPLSVVSTDYKVVQPAEILEFFKVLVEGNDFEMETAGSLRGGNRIWALAKVGEDAQVLDGDMVRPYLLLATSYDGSTATTAQFTSIRVVCNNTLKAAVGDHGSQGRTYEPRVRISHLSKFDAPAVREQLSIVISSWEAFLLKTKKMAAKKFEHEDLESFLLDLYRVNRAEEQAVKAARKTKAYRRITELFNGEGLGADRAGKTLWGAVNAVTQYIDYERGNTPDTGLEAAWFGEGAAVKDRALAMAQKLVAA